jgi:exonuclease III
MANTPNCIALNWNVRSLNAPARRQVVKEMVADHRCNIVCLQETKMQSVDDRIVAETLGQAFLRHYAVLPAVGTRGGILLAIADGQYTMLAVDIRTYSAIVTIRNNTDGGEWTVTGVYGPQDDAAKLLLMQELRQIKLTAGERWAIMGDFNLICRASDKSNAQVNRRLLGSFQALREELEVKELQLQGRRFTWSSGSADSTLTKIDHVFISQDWEFMFPHCDLQALGSAVSDHCPMLLTCNPFAWRYRGFRFESHWLHAPDFPAILVVPGSRR